MAKVTNAYTSYNASGNREDLSDLISNLSPVSTPFISAIGKRSITNRTWSWQVESLASVDSNNFQQEGFIASNQTATTTTLKTGTAQVLTKNAVVAATQEKILSAGRKSEMAHQLSVRAKELKRDLESFASGANAMVVGDDTGPTARKMEGFEHAIQTNVSGGTSYASASSSTGTQTDGTLRNFSSTILDDTMQLAWTNGGEPSLMIVGPALRRKASGFSGRTGLQVPVAEDTLVNSITIYEGDFGVLRIVGSRFCRTRTALLVDPSLARLAYLRPVSMVPLAKTGDADVTMLVTEVGVQVDNELGHGKCADLQ